MAKPKPERTWGLVAGFELRKAMHTDFWAIFEGGNQITGHMALPLARKRAAALRKSRNEPK